jgi:long-chain acyl-CoA synthetase
MGSLDSWVGYWSRRGPQRPVLDTADGTCSWADLATRARLWADELRRRGVAPGDRVAVVTADPRLLLAVLSACAEVGAAAVPTEPGWPGAAQVGAAAGARITVTNDGPVAGPAQPPPPAGSDPGPGTALEAPLLLPLIAGRGVPERQVALDHTNVEAVAVAGLTANGLVPTDRVAIACPPASPPALAFLCAALHAGAQVRFLADPTDDPPFDATGPTVLLAAAGDLGAGDRLVRLLAAPVSALRAVVVPEPVPDTLRREFARVADAPLLSGAYGVAAGGGLSMQEPPGAGENVLVPLLGQRARVVGAHREPLAPGTAGMLELAGSAIPSALRDEGWLRTGDHAVADTRGRFRITTASADTR